MGHTPRCSGVLFMLELKLELPGLDRSIRGLELLTERNLRFATGRAMAATVRSAEQTLKKDLASPSGPIEGGATRWTIGGTYTQRPSPNNLTAEVGLRADRPRAAGRYISVLTKGGRPRTKGVDLKAGGIAGGARLTIVPTPSQRKDSKGNVTRAAFSRAISQASMIRDGKQYNRGAGRFFIIPIKGPAGRMGIFERTGKPGRGRYGSFQGTAMRFTLEPQPKLRRSTYDLKGDLQRSTGRVWPGEIRQQLMAELQRAGFR
jgi:hypothetical protein